MSQPPHFPPVYLYGWETPPPVHRAHASSGCGDEDVRQVENNLYMPLKENTGLWLRNACVLPAGTGRGCSQPDSRLAQMEQRPFVLAHPVIGSRSNALYILQTRPGSLVLLSENGASFPFPCAHHQAGVGARFAWSPPVPGAVPHPKPCRHQRT